MPTGLKGMGERHKGDRNSLCGLIGAIRDVADPEYQLRVWVRGEGPEVSSFTEIVAQIFDDYRIEEMAGELGRDLGLTERQQEWLQRFSVVLDRRVTRVHNYIQDDERIVEEEEWHEVTSLASETSRELADWFSTNCDGSEWAL